MHLDHALTALSLIFVMVVADESCHLSDALRSCTYICYSDLPRIPVMRFALQLEVGEGPKRRHVTVTVAETGSI